MENTEKDRALLGDTVSISFPLSASLTISQDSNWQVGREPCVESGITHSSPLTAMKKIVGRIDSCLRNNS